MAKITASMIQEILVAIGGKGNVIKCGNCMTRLCSGQVKLYTFIGV